MKVENYNGSIGSPDYFAKHYHELGYRIRLVMAQNDDDGRPDHVIKSEDYNPFVDEPVNTVMHSNIVIQSLLNTDIPTDIPKDFDTYPATPAESYQRKKVVVPIKSYHSWRKVKAHVPGKEYCTKCGCLRSNVRVKLGSKTMKWIYTDKDDNDSDVMPECNPTKE